tara:strand:- start:7840 stop:8079 length:240 start_codon:yes stop_codon:yes gene_type:complete
MNDSNMNDLYHHATVVSGYIDVQASFEEVMSQPISRNLFDGDVIDEGTYVTIDFNQTEKNDIYEILEAFNRAGFEMWEA